MSATLGSRVRARRRAMKLTLMQLATRMGCEPATLSRIENGHVVNPKQRILQGLADNLKTTIGELCGDEQRKRRA